METQQSESQAPKFTECLREDTFKAAIKDVTLIEHRFQKEGEDELEVRIDFITAAYEAGKIYLDFSDKTIQTGKNSGRKSCELSAESLTALGHDFSKGFGNLKNLNGLNIMVNGYRNPKGYLNFYLSNGKPETEIDPVDAMQKFNSLFAAPAQPQATPATTPQPAQKNMFEQPAQPGGAPTTNVTPFPQSQN